MKPPHIFAPAACAMFLAMSAAIPAAAGQKPVEPSSDGGVSDLAAFPTAREGQKRHVIRLPAHDDEEALKIELIVGRTMKIDCNSHSFGGRIEERTAQGWGYNYYVLKALGPGISTQKGCPSGSERDAFVRSSYQALVRYNSRLPLVVYAPDDVEVRYRIWRADAESLQG